MKERNKCECKFWSRKGGTATKRTRERKTQKEVEGAKTKKSKLVLE